MARKVAIPLAVFGLFVIVILQNGDPVEVNFLFWDAKVPLVGLLTGWSFLGFLCGFIAAKMLGRPETEPGTGDSPNHKS